MKKIITSLVIALLIEVFVCNFPAFRTLFVGNFQQVEFGYEEIIGEEGRYKIVISDIGVRVTSINIEYDELNDETLRYSLVYKVADNNMEVALKDKIILKDGKHYINFDSQSECEKIFLIIETKIQYSKDYKIKNITINKPNFNINFFRIIILFTTILCIQFLKSKKIYTYKYDKNSKLQHYSFIVFLSLICTGVFIYTITQNQFQSLFILPNDVSETDATLMQTEAFINKSIKLLVDPNKKLINMEDPYNYGEKIENNIPFLFDIAYYDGAYYSYFGVAPIFLLVLPFRIITGGYLRSYVFNLVFVFAIIFLFYSVYKKLIDKYVKNVSLINFYIGYIAMLSASNILNTLKGSKYEIPVTCGIMCILIAIRLAMSIGEKTKFEKLKLIILRF